MTVSMHKHASGEFNAIPNAATPVPEEAGNPIGFLPGKPAETKTPAEAYCFRGGFSLPVLFMPAKPYPHPPIPRDPRVRRHADFFESRMPPLLLPRDCPVPDPVHHVTLRDRCQPVRNDHQGLPPMQTVDGFHDRRFGLRIKRRSRLIKK